MVHTGAIYCGITVRDLLLIPTASARIRQNHSVKNACEKPRHNDNSAQHFS